LKIIILIREL